jgi:hypothetical protein
MSIETVKLKDIKFSFLNRQILSVDVLNNVNYNWSSLIESIKENGFLPEKYGYMIISKNGILLEGHHRYMVLKKLYGENYEIKIIREKKSYVTVILLIIIIILVFILPMKLFKMLKNVFKYFNSYRTTKKKLPK